MYAAAMLAVEFLVVLSVIGIKEVFRSTAPLPCKRETPLARQLSATLVSDVNSCEAAKYMEVMDINQKVILM